MAESSATALVQAVPAGLAVGGTSIPQGVRVLWSERQDRLSFQVEVVEPEAPSVTVNDAGAIAINVRSEERCLEVRLQLFSQIDAAKTRWTASGRGISFELTKLRIGRWGALVAGVTPATIKVDWSQYVDEEEEREAKLYPHGYDIYKMRGAMGKDWGSNVARELAAQKQIRAINTSKPDDEDEEIACF
jgi:hypothetical protein